MKEKTCCFTGHREIPFLLKPIIYRRICKEITTLIERGIVYFGSGGACGFDLLAAEAVLELKQKYPDIKLIMVLPCKHQTDKWCESDKKRYNSILSHSDKIVYISNLYVSGCMHKRNRHLVDNSAYCICYFKHSTGGTAYTVEYARKKDLKLSIWRRCK